MSELNSVETPGMRLGQAAREAIDTLAKSELIKEAAETVRYTFQQSRLAAEKLVDVGVGGTVAGIGMLVSDLPFVVKTVGIIGGIGISLSTGNVIMGLISAGFGLGFGSALDIAYNESSKSKDADLTNLGDNIYKVGVNIIKSGIVSTVRMFR